MVDKEDGTLLADDYFNIFVSAGQTIDMDHTVTESFLPSSSTDTSAFFGLYSTQTAKPVHTDEPGVRKEGELRIHSQLPRAGRDQSISCACLAALRSKLRLFTKLETRLLPSCPLRLKATSRHMARACLPVEQCEL